MIQQKTDADEAATILRLALPMMSRHAIPVTPNNYAVWYRYVEGANKALQESIDAHVASGRPFTGIDNDAFYRRFVLDYNEETVEAVRRSVRSLMDGLAEGVDAADAGLERYNKQLDAHGERLGDVGGPGDLLRLVKDLAEETCAARATGNTLQARLQEGRRDIEHMRGELERLRNDASTDPLTGLPNRRTLTNVLRELFEQAPEDAPFSLLFVDIDRFKTVNDTYGHLFGDKVIRHVANTMQRAVKGCDTVSRYGGEEFVVVLPDTPYEGACALANKLRKAIESSRLVRADTRESLGTVTASVGVAQWQPSDTIEGLLERADTCLALAKRHGRNRAIGERDAEYLSAA